MKAAFFVLAAASTASAQVQYETLRYHDDSCSKLNFYDIIDFTDTQNVCGRTYEGTDPGTTQYWYQLNQPLPDGCAYTMSVTSSDADRSCGECQFALKDQVCTQWGQPVEYWVGYCCGTTCQQQCASLFPTKRDLDDFFASNETVRAAPNVDPAKLRSRSLLADKTARDESCAYAPSSDLTQIAGDPQRIGNNIPVCNSPDGCQTSYSSGVTSMTTDTFGVSMTAEAGLFDIVSVSVSFSYDHSYSQGTMQTISGTYTVANGASGYLTWTPVYQCTSGAFNGNCDSNGIPTGQDGQACVPVTDGNGIPIGDVNLVTVG